MLTSPTPFPYVGSYALIEHEGDTTLARIVMRRATPRVGADGGEHLETEVVVSLPLREGASGNLRVPFDTLIDASPLSREEQREFHDLDRELFSREDRIRRWDGDGARPRLSPAQRAKAARRDQLRRRMLAGPIMDRLLRFAGQRKAA